MEPCEQRDEAFWRGIFTDPDVAPALFGRSPDAVLEMISHPGVLPLATKNGGLLFISRDAFGKVFELHSAYKRAGWGREVLFAAKAAFTRLFESGALVVFTQECVGNWRTRPPLSFGFRPCGEPFENDIGAFRLWMLTQEAWAASHGSRKREIH
jgi:hypothetical protein